MASTSSNKSPQSQKTSQPQKPAPSQKSTPSSTKAPQSQKSKPGLVNSSNIGLWLIGASVVILALVIGIIVFNENRAKTAPVEQPQLPKEWLGRTSKGNPQAPVVVTAWEDYMCPTCQQWTRTVEPQLFEEYIKSGKVRMEFRQFPLQQHLPGSLMSALASECAADQGYFWPYHDRLFQVAAGQGQSALQLQPLIDYAKGIGLDEQKFTSCLNSQQHQPDIDKSLAEANRLNLPGTPSIFVGDKLMQGSDYASLKAEIDAQLAAAGQK